MTLLCRPIVLIALLAALAAAPTAAQENSPPRSGPALALSPALAERVAHQIWLNETGGNPDGVIAWNAGEDFISVGIGHFIWFPAGSPAPFVETFPRFIAFLRRQNAPLPEWLDKAPLPACPWNSRAEFLKARTTPRYLQVRKFLDDTKAAQIQFLLARTQSAFDAIIAKTADEGQRRHLAIQYARITKASTDLYPLIDYVNFKGEGIELRETASDRRTGTNEGWGLRHVLLGMSGSSDDARIVLGEFADSARAVLLRRIRNQPQTRRWKNGWLRRVATYRQPLVGAVTLR